MTYSDAIQFLYGLRLFGTKLGLENSFRLADLAGAPQHRLRFIHVAGTNGKGSTCAMLESIYRAVGLRVGLFTSPHLVSFRERIQVDRQLISEADVVRLVQEHQHVLKEFPDSMHPTFFEVVTVMALRYFAEHQCDLVIWETGLGGRLDATNIVRPLASVITNVQLDHEKWLGSTVAEIAAEKAGIIKPGIPALTAAESEEAWRVIRGKAEKVGSPLVRVTRSDVSVESAAWHPEFKWQAMTKPANLENIEVPLLGEHQRLNAALAHATVQVLQEQVAVSPGALVAGLERVQWPGRLQRHKTADGRVILLDGAHNPAGAETLRDALQQYYPGQAPTLILGIFQDKDWAAMSRLLAPVARRVLIAPVQSERTAAPADLEAACRRSAPGRDVTVCPTLAAAFQLAESDPFVVVTGSLHFVGEAMEILELLPGSGAERSLNEWDAAGQNRAAPIPS